jgi:hypothetical protein
MAEEDARQKMTDFALTFHVMQWDVPGVKPWDAEKVDEWAAGPRSHGERVVGQFLLAVWDPATEWKCGHDHQSSGERRRRLTRCARSASVVRGGNKAGIVQLQG